MRKKRSSARRRANNTKALVPVIPSRALVSVSKKAQHRVSAGGRRSRRVRRSNIPPIGLNVLSPQGLAFLKCTTSAPDFQTDPGRGIPDRYEGRALPLKHATTASLSFAGGKDTYIIFPPIAGVMMLTCTVDAGAQPNKFKAVFHEDATTGGFSKFRFASTCVSFRPTSNMNEYGGSIIAYKKMITLGLTAEAAVRNFSSNTDGTTKRIRSNYEVPVLHDAVITTTSPVDNYASSFIDGVYMQALNMSPDFEFRDSGAYINLYNYVPESVDDKAYPDPHDTQTLWTFSEVVTGLGDLETIVIKINTPEGAKNSAIVKVWQCLEVTMNTKSPMYKMMSYSPPFDPLALMCYRKLAQMLPLGVPARENAHSWEKISEMILTILRAASYLPGPAGVISGGLGMAMSGIRDLTI